MSSSLEQDGIRNALVTLHRYDSIAVRQIAKRLDKLAEDNAELKSQLRESQELEEHLRDRIKELELDMGTYVAEVTKHKLDFEAAMEGQRKLKAQLAVQPAEPIPECQMCGSPFTDDHRLATGH